LMREGQAIKKQRELDKLAAQGAIAAAPLADNIENVDDVNVDVNKFSGEKIIHVPESESLRIARENRWNSDSSSSSSNSSITTQENSNSNDIIPPPPPTAATATKNSSSIPPPPPMWKKLQIEEVDDDDDLPAPPQQQSVPPPSLTDLSELD